MNLNINKSKCISKKEGLTCKSKGDDGYGGYCKKHRKEYLLEDNSIILERFTSNCKDYTLQELKYYYTKNIKSEKPKKPIKSIKPIKYKKADYFQEIEKLYLHTKHIQSNLETIIRLQSFIRRKLIKDKIKYQGFAIFNRNLCRNDEDFYTYELKTEIDPVYFFSYQDPNKIYWCFDIRSLNKLIDMNYGNPYTTEPIPDSTKQRVIDFTNNLREKNIQVHIPITEVIDRKASVKQKLVDVFSQMEYAGYSCNVEWILGLNSQRLKRLYRELEDIWNYRAGLSNSVKKDIVPPNGQLFIMPVADYMNCSTLLDLQEILVNELIKVLGARSPSDMNLAFMYIIIGLSIVSRPCYLVHYHWVSWASL